jgi:hypothetical protein
MCGCFDTKEYQLSGKLGIVFAKIDKGCYFVFKLIHNILLLE